MLACQTVLDLEASTYDEIMMRPTVANAGGRPKRQGRRAVNYSTTDLSVLVQHYQLNNRIEGKSPRTLEWYQEVLELLRRWLEEQGWPTTLGSIDEPVIREFILHLEGRPGTKGPTVSSHTMYNRVNALRSFFSWLHRAGYTPEHVLGNLRQPKVTKLVIEPLTTEEIAQVFASINADTLFGGRNAAFFSLMLDTGARLSEVALLKEENVHLDRQYIKVMGKGAKERMIAFGGSCRKALLHYYDNCRAEPVHPEVDTFFLAVDGYPMTPAPYAR